MQREKGKKVTMPAAFQCLRRFYAFGVSVASPFLLRRKILRLYKRL